jgi:hypothetical protein
LRKELRHPFPGDVMNSFVKLAIDPHEGLNRERLSADFDQFSVMTGAGASRHCNDMYGFLTDCSAT